MENNRRKIFFQILKNTAIYKMTIGYIISFAVIALFIFLFEPTIGTYRDSLWYCFVSCTTIGFGDFVATTAYCKDA